MPMDEIREWGIFAMTAVIVIIDLLKNWPKKGNGKHRKP